MKLTYFIKANELIKRPFGQTKSFELDDCTIEWQSDDDGYFQGVSITLKDVQVEGRNEDGIVFAQQDILALKVYRLAAFCSNNLYRQTNLDLLKAESIFWETPKYEAQNEEEKEFLKSQPITGFSSIGGNLVIPNRIDPQTFMNANAFENSSAIATYTDALRIQNPLRKFEQFFKVIEHTYDTRDNFDENVSTHAEKFNAIFTKEKVKELRENRNRCIHPQAKLGPYNSEDVVALKTISSMMNEMKWLAEIFITNPVS